MLKQMNKWVGLALASTLLSACVTQTVATDASPLRKVSASEKKQENAEVRTQLAIEYMKSGDARNATRVIDEVVKSYPTYDVAWYARAQIYQVLKVYDKAEQSFREALKLKPNGAEANNNYGWFLCSVRKNYAGSIVYFDKALADATYPTPEVAYFNKGICFAKQKKFAEADGFFELSLRRNPDFVAVFKERARAYLDSGNLVEADRYLRIYQSKVPDLSASDLLLGWKIAYANKQEQAMYEYEAQLRTNYPYSEEMQAITSGEAVK